MRRARTARGWSLPQLAKRAGVSESTIKRIEAGHSDSARSLPRVQRALGIGDWSDVIDDGPPLRQATIGEIAAELVRRDAEQERRNTERDRVLDRYRIRSGQLPDGILDEPGVIAGPLPDEDDGVQSAT